MKKIVIQDVGEHTIRFLRLLRKATGVGLKTGVAIRDSLPGVLLDGVADDTAQQLTEAFQSIGAKVALEKTDNAVVMIRLASDLKT